MKLSNQGAAARSKHIAEGSIAREFNKCLI